jgi:hypothetical protein
MENAGDAAQSECLSIEGLVIRSSNGKAAPPSTQKNQYPLPLKPGR